ncbi:hypothetical protein [Pseudoxanthomonas dokdonensis]|uniref:Uncharacterized protein n=1 Tax=Pseudoxanthomonas dokdonensis TaxID=344882 RepID=A0A0R0CQ52_9GAMM|nr:hypothetical protein [Pseudoxanthomonas dokdonensis]KRG71701.1 hypothetical protein ABB29_02900 [Pseudoxanthomonas dokdonensis]
MAIDVDARHSAHGHVVHAAITLAESIRSSPKHEPRHFLPLAVFIAFSFEAYMNDVGARVCEFWDQVERNRWREKVEILHSLAGKTTDWGRDPLQFVHQIFALRDSLAHGKPRNGRFGPFDSTAQMRDHMRSEATNPSHFKHLNLTWLETSMKRFHAGMKYFAALYNLPENDYLLIAKTQYEGWVEEGEDLPI